VETGAATEAAVRRGEATDVVVDAVIVTWTTALHLAEAARHAAAAVAAAHHSAAVPRAAEAEAGEAATVAIGLHLKGGLGGGKSLGRRSRRDAEPSG